MTCDICHRTRNARVYVGPRDGHWHETRQCLDCRYIAHTAYREREGVRLIPRDQYMRINHAATT